MISAAAFPADVTVKVTPPTQRTDGTALLASEICCYNIWRGTKQDGSDRKYLGQITAATLSYTDKSVVPGSYFYFATTVADTESDISNAVAITIAKSKAQPPVISVSVTAP